MLLGGGVGCGWGTGIEPMVTLHHFSEPLWFFRQGSFEKEQSIEHFARYVPPPPLRSLAEGGPVDWGRTG